MAEHPHNLNPPAPCGPALRTDRTRPVRRLLQLLIVIAGLMVFWATPPARAADPLAADPDQPWKITADTIEYDDQARTYAASGHVVIQKADKKVSADFIRFNHETMQVRARGNVVVATGDDILCGDRIDLNLTSETAPCSTAPSFSARPIFTSAATGLKRWAKTPTRRTRSAFPAVTATIRTGRSPVGT